MVISLRDYFIVVLVIAISSSWTNAQEFIPYRKRALWGYSDERGGITIMPNYTYADFFNNGLALVGKQQKFGFINRSGKEVIPLRYDAAGNFHQGIAPVKKGDFYGIIDKKGKVISEFKYAQYTYLERGIKVQTKDGVGLFSPEKGKELIPTKYQDIGVCSAELGLIWVKEQNKVGLYSIEKNKILVTPQFDELLSFEKGYAVVVKDNLYGLIDEQGKLILPPKYKYIPSNFFFKRPLKKGNQFIYFNKKGEKLTGYYKTADGFYNGLARVSNSSGYGFISEDGKEVIPLKYKAVSTPEEGRIAIKLQDKWGFANLKGEQLIDYKYESYPEDEYQTVFSEGRCKVKLNGSFGFIDTTGTMIISPEFDEASSFYDGYALVKKNSLYGIINLQGDKVVPIAYTKIYYRGINKYFENSVVLAAKGDKWGLVNNKGEELTKFIYDAPSLSEDLADNAQNELSYSFYEGRCRVSVNGKIGFINQKGKEITPLQFNEAQDFNGGLAAVKIKDKWGFINRAGKQVTPYKYTGVHIHRNWEEEEDNTLYRVVEYRNLWGLLDNTGKEITAMKYEDPVTWQFAFRNGLMWILHKGKDGFVNAEGVEFFQD